MAVPQTVPGPNAGKKARKAPERKPMSNALRATGAIDRLLTGLSPADAKSAITFAVIRLGGQVRFD